LVVVNANEECDALIRRCSESPSIGGDLCFSRTLDVRNPPV
jgi:hypothetical protein